MYKTNRKGIIEQYFDIMMQQTKHYEYLGCHPIRCPNERLPFIDSGCYLRRYSEVGQFNVTVFSQQYISTLDISEKKHDSISKRKNFDTYKS